MTGGRVGNRTCTHLLLYSYIVLAMVRTLVTHHAVVLTDILLLLREGISFSGDASYLDQCKSSIRAEKQVKQSDSELISE